MYVIFQKIVKGPQQRQTIMIFNLNGKITCGNNCCLYFILDMTD